MAEYRNKITDISEYKTAKADKRLPEQAEPRTLTPEDKELLDAMKNNLLGFAAMVHDGYPYFYQQRRKWINADLDGDPEKDKIRSAIDAEWDLKLKVLRAYVPVMLGHLNATIERYGAVSGGDDHFPTLARRYLPVVARLERDLGLAKEKLDIELVMQKADNELAGLLGHPQAS